MKYRWRMALWLACCLPGVSLADGQGWQARVGARDGVPCFGVEDNAQTRAHGSNPSLVEVSEMLGKTRSGPLVWSIGMDEQSARPKLTPGNCFAYAGTITGAEVLQAPRPLRPGQQYHVHFSASLDRDQGQPEPRDYDADFCLGKDAGGRPAVYDLHGRAAPPPGDACQALFKP